MVEIERKFLVSNIEECLSRSQASRRITQGYLSQPEPFEFATPTFSVI